jgi:hypothetical protein
MAINRYDQPAQAQFINTYSPIPFDQMMKVEGMKQERRNQDIAQEDALRQSIASMKVAPGDEKLYNSKIAEAYKLLDAGTQYGVGSQNHMDSIRKARNFLVEDPLMRQMSQNYPAYAQAAEELRKAKAEFEGNPAAYYQLESKLNEFNQGDGTVTGTQYLMNQNGVGNLSTPGVGKPAAIQPEIEKYLKPVKADMLGTESLDESGMFKFGSKTTQITANKLGSVLGIQFKAVVDGKNKKLVVDRENINPPADLISTPAGMFLMQKAKMMSGQSKGQITTEEAYKQLYADDAVRQIEANTSRQSEYTMDANPFALAKYNDDLKNKTIDFSSNLIIASESSKFNSTDAIDEGKANFDLQKARVEGEKKVLMEEYGIKEQVSPIPGTNAVKYIGADGKDYTALVREKTLEAEEFQAQKDNLDKMLEGVKKDARIPLTYPGPTEAMQREADKVGEDLRIQMRSQMVNAGKVPTDEDMVKINKSANKARDEYLEKKDPYFGDLNKALKANAEKLSFNASVVRLGNEKLITASENHFKTAIQNNAFFNTDGTELEPKEKAILAKYSFVKNENGQGDNVHFEGALWNKEKHMYQFAYSINASSEKSGGKKPTVSKTILTEAPPESINYLIDAGYTTQAQQVIQQSMSMMNTDPNKEAVVYFGQKDKDEYAGMARQIRESEKYKYAGAQYILEVKIKGDDGVERITPQPFKDITDAGIWYERYRKTIAELPENK